MIINERIMGSKVEFNATRSDRDIRNPFSAEDKIGKGEIINIFTNDNGCFCNILAEDEDIFERRIIYIKIIKKGSGKEVKTLTRPQIMDLE